MDEESQAYEDAFKRVRAAIAKEIPEAHTNDLDDAACMAVRAAFGMK
jgi:hypothetical protein